MCVSGDALLLGGGLNLFDPHLLLRRASTLELACADGREHRAGVRVDFEGLVSLFGRRRSPDLSRNEMVQTGYRVYNRTVFQTGYRVWN